MRQKPIFSARKIYCKIDKLQNRNLLDKLQTQRSLHQNIGQTFAQHSAFPEQLFSITVECFAEF